MNVGRRSKVKLPLSWKDKALIILATLPIIFIIVYLKIVWRDIPEIVPTHFGFSGAPDAFGSKTYLFRIIGFSTGMHLLMFVLTKMPMCYNISVSVKEKIQKLYIRLYVS